MSYRIFVLLANIVAHSATVIVDPATDVSMAQEANIVQRSGVIDQLLKYPETRSITNDEGVHDDLKQTAHFVRHIELPFEDAENVLR